MSVARIAGLIVALTGFCGATDVFASGETAPKRVVSMNVCTDQLAMLVAGEGQLHSVSNLAADPGISVLADEAGRYVVNHGMGEEVFLMGPDLVLAGTFTAQPAVEMLRRLGFRVEQFPPESTFEGIRDSIRRMGQLLGRQERAEELVAELEAGLDDLLREPVANLSVAVYSANSYTSGEGSLSHAVIEAAGLTNITDKLGIAGVQRIPLEQLVLADPDIVVLGEQHYEKPALAQENFQHPAFRAIASGDRLVRIPDRYWICGAPFTLEAARMLRQAAGEVAEQ
ncbi:ABC transporter substrate-binding protein [Neoaquamicrobium microcysteis]|uniref:ABC transporter substrate-binding protein n=1 Tax=Neoaquamicrobium microcysteis TaxID=2682781 RepID=UPI0011E66436|nr:ABC transporter substrate-binding protein [Mesorhizobium microcysteis]